VTGGKLQFAAEGAGVEAKVPALDLLRCLDKASSNLSRLHPLTLTNLIKGVWLHLATEVRQAHGAVG
jgi:hypothetical protein